jgi:hypothetical protein
MNLKKQAHPPNDLGYQDFFNNRHKLKMLRLADIKSSDVFFDLGCGNASILIFAVKNFNVKKAIGYENNRIRYKNAVKNVQKTHLSETITICYEDILNANLREADVIFDMLPEDEFDFERYQTGIKNGTRLIKHDLPLIGYIADKIDYPFYRMTFPLREASNKKQWASHVLGDNNATTKDLWWELFYYENEKHYTKHDINRCKRILQKRIK